MRSRLHELSEVAPSAYEFTLPREKRYRGSRTRHADGVKIHTATRLDPQDVATVGGIRVTSPARSIVDAGNGGMDLKLVRSAVFDAIRKLKASPAQLLDEAAKSAEPQFGARSRKRSPMLRVRSESHEVCFRCRP